MVGNSISRQKEDGRMENGSTAASIDVSPGSEHKVHLTQVGKINRGLHPEEEKLGNQGMNSIGY